MQKKSRLLEALTGEINDRPIIGLLAILVLLVHLWVVVLLMQPSELNNKAKPIKVMEVALLSESSQKAEAASPAPAPTIPAPPKQVQPKKKEAKPPVKKKAPVVPKPVESTKIKQQKVGDEQVPIPAQPSSSKAVEKPQAPVSAPQTAAVSKPAAKPGNGDSKPKGENSGVVPLVRVPPVYPSRATSRRIEGWVKIEFIVSASGAVSNPAVVSASPAGIFDEAALNNIKKWKFKPKMVNGSPVTQRAVQVIKFTLTK